MGLRSVAPALARILRRRRETTRQRTTTTEAAVEATAVTSRVGTGASTTATTVTMATMVTATTMTRLNVCDVSTEEKERPSNRMHATIN